MLHCIFLFSFFFRLYNKLKDSDQLNGDINEQSDEFREVISPLSKAFPGEVFPQDLRHINDSVVKLISIQFCCTF